MPFRCSATLRIAQPQPQERHLGSELGEDAQALKLNERMFRSKLVRSEGVGHNRLRRNSRGWTRTSDKTVNSRLLYQLSYAGSLHRVSVEQKYSTSEPGGVKDPRWPGGGSRSDHSRSAVGFKFPVTRPIRVEAVRAVLIRASRKRWSLSFGRARRLGTQSQSPD